MISLILYNLLDEISVRSWIEISVLTLNYIIVICFSIVGYWDGSWQFKKWTEYSKSNQTCFQAHNLETKVKELMSKEMQGAEYMRIVRIVDVGLLVGLSAVYGYTLWKNWTNIKEWVKLKRNPPKKAIKTRATRYRESQPNPNKPREMELSQLSGFEEGDSRQNPDNSDMMALKPNSRIISARHQSVFKGIGEEGQVTYPDDEV